MKKVLVGFGIWLVSVSVWAQNQVAPEWEAIVMEYPDLSQVLRYEKMEIGVRLPLEVEHKVNNFIQQVNVQDFMKLNPYLEWDLRIVGTFTHESGVVKQIDGFYYRNFDRDEANDYWTDLGTHYDFRLRFAPGLTGNWTYKTAIYVQGVQRYTSDEQSFRVIESGNPGFVQKHRNGLNLALGNPDSLYFPVGDCLAFPNGEDDWILNYGVPYPYMSNFRMHYWKGYMDNVKRFVDAGGRYLRFIVNPVYSDIEFEKLGDYTDRLVFAYEMDRMLEYAHEHDLYIHFNLRHHTPLYLQSNYEFFHWDFEPGSPKQKSTWKDKEPYAYYPLAKNGKPSDLVADSVAMNYQKQRYRYLIARYGYSTNISLMEIMSEPQHMDGYFKKYSDDLNWENDIVYEPAMESDSLDGMVARKAIYEYHKAIATYIKQHLKHENHLLSAVGTMGKYFTMSAEGKGFTYNDSTLFIPEIDVVAISTYSYYPNKMLISKGNKLGTNGIFELAAGENSYYKTMDYLRDTCFKIPVIAETGVGSMCDDCTRDALLRYDAFKFCFSGVSGVNFWQGYDYSTAAKRKQNDSLIYPSIALVNNFMNGPAAKQGLNEAWKQGRWKMAGNKISGIREMQVYVSVSGERALGYLANNTYNVFTTNVDSSSFCTQVPMDANYKTFVPIDDCTKTWWWCKRVQLQGLQPKTDYRITWYDYNGNESGTEVFTSSRSGSWKMNHPTLDKENPVRVFQIIQQKK